MVINERDRLAKGPREFASIKKQENRWKLYLKGYDTPEAKEYSHFSWEYEDFEMANADFETWCRKSNIVPTDGFDGVGYE